MGEMARSRSVGIVVVDEFGEVWGWEVGWISGRKW